MKTRFEPIKSISGWAIELGPVMFHPDQYGKVRSYGGKRATDLEYRFCQSQHPSMFALFQQCAKDYQKAYGFSRLGNRFSQSRWAYCEYAAGWLNEELTAELEAFE